MKDQNTVNRVSNFYPETALHVRSIGNKKKKKKRYFDCFNAPCTKWHEER